MSMLCLRRSTALGSAAAFVIIGIAIGALGRGMWPSGKASPAAGDTAATSAKKVALEWCEGLNHGAQWTITAAPKPAPGEPVVIHMGTDSAAEKSATAFVEFITRSKFEDVWKHYAEKCRQCGYDGKATESLTAAHRGSPDDPARGGMQFCGGNDEIMALDFAGIGSAKPGVDPTGPRESHFAYHTARYAVHVTIEEIGQDRWESYKGQVKVRVFAAAR